MKPFVSEKSFAGWFWLLFWLWFWFWGMVFGIPWLGVPWFGIPWFGIRCSVVRYSVFGFPLNVHESSVGYRSPKRKRVRLSEEIVAALAYVRKAPVSCFAFSNKARHWCDSFAETGA